MLQVRKPRHRQGNWLAQVIRLVSGRARVWSQAALATGLYCLWVFRMENGTSFLGDPRDTSHWVDQRRVTLLGSYHGMDVGSGPLVIDLSSADTPRLEKDPRNGKLFQVPEKKKVCLKWCGCQPWGKFICLCPCLERTLRVPWPVLSPLKQLCSVPAMSGWMWEGEVGDSMVTAVMGLSRLLAPGRECGRA